MSTGKLIAQAGHAYLGAILNTLDTKSGQAYAALTPGTKICLDGGDESNLLHLYDRLMVDGFKPALITDSGHIEPPDFDGSDVITALGLGPVARSDAPKYLKKLPLFGKAYDALSKHSSAAVAGAEQPMPEGCRHIVQNKGERT